MIDGIDDPITARFAAIANNTDDRDWRDVQRRAAVGAPRWTALAIAAVVAVVATGSAFAVYRELVDFFSAEPAPERIIMQFGQMSVRASVGVGPNVVPEQTRLVAEAEVGGSRRALYVAPTRDGGFCWLWSGATGSCGRTSTTQSPLGVTSLETKGGATQIAGHVTEASVDRLELEYEDGSRTTVPILAWVSPPISAGFFAFDTPDSHLREGHRPKVLRALDRNGGVVAAHAFRYSDPDWDPGPDGLPKVADRTQKRTLFDLVDDRGVHWTLSVAPAPGNRTCYAYNTGGGCISPKFPPLIEMMGIQSGGRLVTVCCAVSEGVSSVELEYEDGDRGVEKPVDGFLLVIIPARHYAVGHRLERIVWRDERGGVVGVHAVPTDHPGIYPCTKDEERDLGYGATVCP